MAEQRFSNFASASAEYLNENLRVERSNQTLDLSRMKQRQDSENHQSLLLARHTYIMVRYKMISKINDVSRKEDAFVQQLRECFSRPMHEITFNWFYETMTNITTHRIKRKQMYLSQLLQENSIAAHRGIPNSDGNDIPFQNLETLLSFYDKITMELKRIILLYYSKNDGIVRLTESNETSDVEKAHIYRTLSQEVTNLISGLFESENYIESLESYQARE